MTTLVRAVVVSLILMFGLVFSSGICAQDNLFSLEIGIEDLAVGDFMEWSMDMNEDDVEMSGHMRFEVTSLNDTITVKGSEYAVLTFKMSGQGTLTSIYGVEGEWEASGVFYIDRTTERNIEYTMTMDMSATYLGQTSQMVHENTSILLGESSTIPENYQLSIGDSWTETKIEEITETETIIYPDGEEDTSTKTTTVTTVVDYEYYSEDVTTVPAGTFNTSVFYIVDRDNPKEYTIGYFDRQIGLEVKYEYYDDNDDLTGEVELIAFNFESLQESGGESVLGPIEDDIKKPDDKGLFNLGKLGALDIFILLVIAIFIIMILIGIIVVKKSGKSTAQSETEYTKQSASTQPKSAQQAPVSNCPSCGGQLTYVEPYQRWYCFSCKRYQ